VTRICIDLTDDEVEYVRTAMESAVHTGHLHTGGIVRAKLWHAAMTAAAAEPEYRWSSAAAGILCSSLIVAAMWTVIGLAIWWALR
jgi:hypothetical protein